MPLYPTLEDMKVDELHRAQAPFMQTQTAPAQHYPPAVQYPTPATNSGPQSPSLYPSLSSYMGLSLATVQSAVGDAQSQSNLVVAPVSHSNAVGIKRAEIQPGLRKVVLCKDMHGKIGLMVKDISKGVFVACVTVASPAALAGLRFGDQLLEINGEAVAGYSADKVITMLKKCKGDRIEVVVRDRPYERTITLNKDSNGYVGFCFSNGKISNIVKDSSAARNGLLIDHQLVEVDGQNVVAMNDKQIGDIMNKAPRTVTVTIMPSVLYDHMVKCIGLSILRKHMDRSVPDV